jgi:hypothetical protein
VREFVDRIGRQLRPERGGRRGAVHESGEPLVVLTVEDERFAARGQPGGVAVQDGVVHVGRSTGIWLAVMASDALVASRARSRV